MFNEFLPLYPSWQNCLFCLVLYMVLVMLTMKERMPYYNPHANTKVGWLLVFVFFMFSFFNDDWFSYFNHVSSAQYDIGSLSSLTGHEAMERIYIIIAFALDGDYLLWRVVVFGMVLVLLYCTGRRLELKSTSYLYALALIATPVLCYARASLAMAIGFWGLSFLIRPMPMGKTPSFLLGSFLLIISAFFHKSALVLPLIIYLAYTFKLSKLKILILFLFFIVFFVLLNSTDLINRFLSGEDVQYFINQRIADKYLTSEKHLSGWGKSFIAFMRWTAVYFYTILALSILINKKLKSKYILPYVNAVVIIVLFASVFLFVNKANTYTLYYRYLNFAIIPISIVVAHCLYVGIYRKAFMRVTLLFVSSSIMGILYSVYSAYVHY